MSTDLYKSQGVHSKEYRQSERRHAMLEIHKQRRNELLDKHRRIEPLKKIFCKPRHPKHLKIKNQLMLSEWLKEVPNDIEKWFLKPCPKGNRVLVIAVDGTTQVFHQYGAFMRRFSSELPGGRKGGRKWRESLTVLDCVYIPNLDEYYVLDALAYGNQALTECEAEFRFYWIESQISELKLDEVTQHNHYVFRVIEKCNCGDNVMLNDFLSKYPIWPNNEPKLDGFLFYHGEASYVNGETPLVGWLFDFMIPEVFDVPLLNVNYLMDKPADYLNYLAFMKQFDENLGQKRRNRRKQRIERMQEGEDEQERNEPDGNGAVSIIKQTMELENDDSQCNEFKEFEEF